VCSRSSGSGGRGSRAGFKAKMSERERESMTPLYSSLLRALEKDSAIVADLPHNTSGIGSDMVSVRVWEWV